MINLSKITITVHEDDEDDGPYADLTHAAIEVAADAVADLVTADARDWPGDTAAWIALRQSAGVLARVGLWASRWMPEQQAAHGCRPIYSPSEGMSEAPSLMSFCHVGCAEEIFRPDADWGSGLAISLHVPREQKAVWLDRLREWLAVIAKGEAGLPISSAPADTKAYRPQPSGPLDQPCAEPPSLCLACGEPLRAAAMAGGFKTHPTCGTAA